MDNHNSDELSFETENYRIYYLSGIFVAASLTQWLLLVNFECFDFLLNYWLLFGVYIAFCLIAIVCIAMDLNEKSLPAPLRWLFAVLIFEIFNIALGATIVQVTHLALYCSLAAVVIFLSVLLSIGRTIKLDYLPVMVLLVFGSNILFIILILLLMMLSRFLAEFYSPAFFIISAICVIILTLNIVYISMLIQYHRHRLSTLTSCLTLALYVHVLFGAFVWFSLSLAIEISKIHNSTS